jgi:hypothetical protein
MFSLFLIMLAQSTDTVTIFIDNRNEACVTGSRIAEGNRRRAEIAATQKGKSLEKQGIKVKYITLEPGDRVPTEGGSVITLRTDC